MLEVSTVRSHALRHRPATIIDALWAAASQTVLALAAGMPGGSAWLVAAIANELRVRRDMRQLAAMDDHMLKDIGLHRCEIEYGVRTAGADEMVASPCSRAETRRTGCLFGRWAPPS